MGKRYTNKERREALKLAEEIGAATAARRIGISVDTLVQLARPGERAC